MKLFFLLFFSFFLTNFSAQQTKLNEKSATEPYTIVEQMPEYPGGEDAYMRFLQKNIKYPNHAIENEIQGTVYANFVICEDGSICQLKITKSPDSSLSRATEEILAKMPNWKPGKQGGESVRVYFDAPITFALPEDEGATPTDINNFTIIELSKDEVVNFKFLAKKTNEFKYYRGADKPIKVDGKGKLKRFQAKVNESYHEAFYIYDIKYLGDPSVIEKKFKIAVK
jgi:TonB family protein